MLDLEQRQLLLLALRAGFDEDEALRAAGIEKTEFEAIRKKATKDGTSPEARLLAEISEAHRQESRAKLMASAVLRSYAGDPNPRAAREFLYHLESERQARRAQELTTY